MTTYGGVEYMEVGGQTHAPAVLPRGRASDNRCIGRWLGPRAMWKLWRVQAMECYSCWLVLQKLYRFSETVSLIVLG